MPRMDGTGPAGQGSMTGRGLGPCGTGGVRNPQTGVPQQSSWLGRLWGAVGGLGIGSYYGGMRRGGGRGPGGGRGQGRGRRRTF